MESEPSGLSDAHFVSQLPSETENTTASYENISFTDPQWETFEKLVNIVVPTVFGGIFVLGLFGNSLVILVVLTDKHMRNTTNILILSLAAADLLFILFCVPFTAAGYVLKIWPFGDIGCKATNYAMYVCAYASVYTLVMMSLDRYLAVVHAIRSMSWRSERNTWIGIAIIWVIILCGNIPIVQQWGVHVYQWTDTENRSACYQISALDNLMPEQLFFGCFFFFGYVIPLGITVLLYGLMLKRLLYGVVPGGGSQSSESMRAKKRVTRMVIIVVVIFALCWLPIQIVLFGQKVLNMPKTIPYLVSMLAANCLAYMNSCVNPILYAFLSGNFRRSFRRFLCCSGSTRRMDYERTNIRFTVTEKEANHTKSTCINNSKTYTAV